MSTIKKVISKDHIVLIRDCGCKLHIFTTDQYEELCEKCKKNKKKGIIYGK